MTRFLSILLAEDSDVVRASVASALDGAGHRVTAVGDGQEALGRLRAARYDVLVTDLWMPVLDGLSLIKAAHAVQPALRVIAMTGGGPRLTIETATALAEVWGAERVLLKPFDEADLIATLARSPE